MTKYPGREFIRVNPRNPRSIRIWLRDARPGKPWPVRIRIAAMGDNAFRTNTLPIEMLHFCIYYGGAVQDDDENTHCGTSEE